MGTDPAREGTVGEDRQVGERGLLPVIKRAIRATPPMNKIAHALAVAWGSPRWRRALIIAAISDALGFGVVLLAPAQWLLDAVTAAALLLALGFRWPLLVALAIEVVPGLELFPAWTLVVLAMAGTTAQAEPEHRGTEPRLPPRQP